MFLNNHVPLFPNLHSQQWAPMIYDSGIYYNMAFGNKVFKIQSGQLFSTQRVQQKLK